MNCRRQLLWWQSLGRLVGVKVLLGGCVVGRSDSREIACRVYWEDTKVKEMPLLILEVIAKPHT